MKRLITGASGFIGSHLNGIPLVSNVENRISLKREINEKSEGEEYIVIHCAAITDVEECENNKECFNVNVKGTQNVLESIDPEIGKLILLSSCHVFSGDKYFPYTERHSPNPVNSYGASKYGAEALTAIYSVPSLVVRLGRVYDESWIDDALSLNPETKIPNFIVRNFVHVEDVSMILHALCDEFGYYKYPRYKNFYNVLHIGNPDQNYSYHMFYNLIRDKYGASQLPKRVLEISGMVPRPFRVALRLKNMIKILGKDFSFRSF